MRTSKEASADDLTANNQSTAMNNQDDGMFDANDTTKMDDEAKTAKAANIKVAKTPKSSLSKDENIIAPNPPESAVITHRPLYAICDVKFHVPKTITVPSNNVEMNIFSSYTTYNRYSNADAGHVQVSYLPPLGTMLSDF